MKENKKILFISPQLCFPPVDGGKQCLFYRILEISKHLETYAIFVNSDNLHGYKSEQTYRQMKESVKELQVFERYNASIRYDSNLVKKLNQILLWFISKKPRRAQKYESDTVRQKVTQYIIDRNIEVVCLEFPWMFELIDIKALKIKGIKIICVIHNIEHLFFYENKDALGFSVNINLLTYYEGARVKKYEYDVFRQMDLVIGIADYDVEYVKKEIGLNNIVYSPTLFQLPQYSWSNNISSDYIVFPGSLLFYPNFEGIMWFLDNVFQYYTRKYPKITLKITGKTNPTIQKKIGKYQNVELTGFLSEQKLQELVVNSLFAIAPIFSGAGVKIKLLEAMSYGLPIITTPKGAQGIPYQDKEPFYVANNKDEFLEYMFLLSSDLNIRKKLGEKAKVFFELNYYDKENYHRWIDLL